MSSLNKRTGPVKAVVFDLDGTLYDQSQYIDQGFAAAARKIQKDFGLSARAGAALLKHMRRLYAEGKRVRIFNQVLAPVLAHLGARGINEYVEKHLLYYYKLTPRRVRLWPQAKTLLQFLRRRKLRIGLVTQGSVVDQVHKLVQLQAVHLFDVVEISGFYPAAKAKPSPFMFRRVLTRLGVRPSESIFVGDDLHNDIGAAQAGMRFLFLVSKKDKYLGKDPRVNVIRSLLQVKDHL